MQTETKLEYQLVKISPDQYQKFPLDWKKQQLDEIADIIDPYPSHRAPKIDPDGVPYLGIGDFDENGNVVNVSRRVGKDTLEEQKITFSLVEGDLAIGRVASIGKIVKLQPTRNYTISPTLCIVKPKINSVFLLQSLRSSFFQNQMSANVSGSTRSSVGIQTVRKLLIMTPSTHEQQKIASILSNVDSLIESYNSIIAQTKKLKQGLMQRLLTKGIGHTKFKKVKWYFGKKIEIPQEWQFVNFDDISKRISYGFTNPMPDTNDGPWMITATNIKNGQINYNSARKTDWNSYTELLTDKSKPVPGTVLITKDGTLGEVAIVDRRDICVNQSVATIEPDTKKIIPAFLVLALQSRWIKRLIQIFSPQTTIRHISITDLAEWHLFLPPLPEQQKIVSILNTIDSKITDLQTKKSSLEKLKKGLMQKLLTGQIRVKI